MAVITAEIGQAIDRQATTESIRQIVAELADAIGTRMTAHVAGLKDAKQISRYRRPDGPTPGGDADRRLREGFKVVQTIMRSYDVPTARAWLFGTNTRLDDRAPIDVLRGATETQDFIDVLRAARQFASHEG